MRLILASQSPYRAALLKRLSIPFEQLPSAVDEDKFKSSEKDPYSLAKILAYQKAKAVQMVEPKAFVIGGDQISLLEGKILGKPGTTDKAIDQLQELQGRSHQLITSTCILGPQEKKIEWQEVITLKMRKLTKEECVRYVGLDNPIHCAGSYKFEEHGIALFEKVQGDDHSAIVGMPLIRLGAELHKLGLRTS